MLLTQRSYVSALLFRVSDGIFWPRGSAGKSLCQSAWVCGKSDPLYALRFTLCSLTLLSAPCAFSSPVPKGLSVGRICITRFFQQNNIRACPVGLLDRTGVQCLPRSMHLLLYLTGAFSFYLTGVIRVFRFAEPVSPAFRFEV